MIVPSHMLEDIGPPTDYMLKARRWIVFLMTVGGLCVIGRSLVGDVMGGFCQLIVCGLAYAIAFGEPVCQIRWVWMFTFFSFLNFGFDFGLALVRSVHVYKHYKVPGSKDDLESKFTMNQIAFVLVVSWVSCLTELFGAVVGYRMFKNYHEENTGFAFAQDIGSHPSYGTHHHESPPRTSGAAAGTSANGQPAMQQRQAIASIARGEVNTRLPEPVQPSFEAFKGKPHTLEKDEK